MTVRTRSEAVARARTWKAYPKGMCLQWTRLMYGIGALGDYDGNGRANAVDAWKRADHKHPGDRTPPAGVPVYWSGGSKGDGHVAISLGNGRIRGTDSPTSGHIGTVGLDWVEKTWGLTYLGWSADLNGVTIPDDITPKAPPKPTALTRGRRVDRALILLRRAHNRARTNNRPVRAKRIRAAITALEKIKEKSK